MNRLRAGALVVACTAILAGCSSNGPSAPNSVVTLPALSSTPTSAAVRQAELVGEGLRKIIAAHPLSKSKPDEQLTSCPMGTVRSLTTNVDSLADGATGKYEKARAVVQLYKVKPKTPSVSGDNGVAVSCTALTKTATIAGFSGTTYSRPIPPGKVSGLDGPLSYREGNTYTRTDDPNECTVYWVPPGGSYVLTVFFRAKTTPTTASCRTGFDAAAPTMINSLAALAG